MTQKYLKLEFWFQVSSIFRVIRIEKQICSFLFGEKLWLNNFVSRSNDLYTPFSDHASVLRGFHRSSSWLHIYYTQAKVAPIKTCKIVRTFRPKMHFDYLVFLDCLNGLTFVCSDPNLFRLQWSYKHASMFWNRNMSTCTATCSALVFFFS